MEFLEKIRANFAVGGACDKRYGGNPRNPDDTEGHIQHNSSEGPSLVHNPYGRAGSPRHRAPINDIKRLAEETRVEDDGYMIKTEYYVKTKGGLKGHRFVDIAIFNEDQHKYYFFQSGLLKQNGFPISREVYAILDISNSTRCEIMFIGYNHY